MEKGKANIGLWENENNSRISCFSKGQVLKPKNGISIPLEWKRFTKIDFVGEFKEANFEKPNFAWEFIFK